MLCKSIWENGVVLSFDLYYNELKKYYSETSPENAYKVIKKFLINNGFKHIKDSDYFHNDINKIKTFKLINRFSKNNIWFPLSIKKIIISPNVSNLDITDEVKNIGDDYLRQNEKDKENDVDEDIVIKEEIVLNGENLEEELEIDM